MTDQTPAQQQAAGLRALADLIEQNPFLAKPISYALEHMHAPIVSDNPRLTLTAFHEVAKAAGADVEVFNRPERCLVAARFAGGVGLSVTASADQMAGVPERAQYTPLFEDEGAE